MADKAALEAFLENLETKITIYFGKTTEALSYADHACIVDRQNERPFSYTVEGHGIGSSEKPPADLKDTVRRIFADCQRFCGGDTVTIAIPKD